MVTCPKCRSDDLDLLERLGGNARLLRCNSCGNRWQRGEIPRAADPGQTKDQRLRARFPTVEDVPPQRIDALRELVLDPARPRWSEHQAAFRAHYQEVFSTRDGVLHMTAEDFKRFFVGDDLANVGPARFAAEKTLKELGPELFLERVQAALEYLLFDEQRPLEQRLTDLVDGQASPAVKGIREAILTKVLAAAWPDLIFPALVYDSEQGSGKRQVSEALFGLSLPPRDRNDWTIGRLAIWSNDLFVDVASKLGFHELPSAADFVWGMWKRHQEGEDLLPALD